MTLAQTFGNEPETVVKITNSIRGWLERKARLLGLDMPNVNVNLDGGKVTYTINGIEMEAL